MPSRHINLPKTTATKTILPPQRDTDLRGTALPARAEVAVAVAVAVVAVTAAVGILVGTMGVDMGARILTARPATPPRNNNSSNNNHHHQPPLIPPLFPFSVVSVAGATPMQAQAPRACQIRITKSSFGRSEGSATVRCTRLRT